MKIFLVLVIACLAVTSAAAKMKSGNTKFNSTFYCDALGKASSLYKSSLSKDPVSFIIANPLTRSARVR